VPRTLSIHFPDGETQFWFTDRLFAPGDKIDRNGVPWIVTSIGESDGNAKHASITVRPHELSQSSDDRHFA
jgi:hypothetical protein